MELSNHPGCFGLPTAISANAASCRTCTYRGECGSAASALLASMPDSPNITRERKNFALTLRAFTSVPLSAPLGTGAPVVVASSRGLKRMPLTAHQLDCISRFPTRVRSQVRQLMERGWFDFAKSELRAGRNPADKGWRHIFCQHLLRGPTPRTELKLALIEKLDLSPGSADAQVSTGIAIFAAGRLATEHFGALTLNSN